jgi:polyisoprenoid-binding protein YceI
LAVYSGGIVIFRRLVVLAAVAAAFAWATPAAPDEARAIDKAGSKIEFRAKATFAKVDGVFHEWEAELRKPGDTFDTATLKITLDTESVTTGNGLRDKEIKSKNFFDVKQFPNIEFVSSKVTPGPDPTKFVMEGTMTMRGISKPVTVMIVEHPATGGHQMIDGAIEFNRRDFGMVHNAPLNKVANEVEVEFHLNVTAGKAAAAGN